MKLVGDKRGRLTLVGDKRGRLTSAKPFRPGTASSVEGLPDGSIRIVELVEKRAPVVSPKSTKEGFLMLPKKLDRRTVAVAIGEDRHWR